MSDSDDGGDQKSELELTAEFERYRSLRDSSVIIIVSKDVVPFQGGRLGAFAAVNRSRFGDKGARVVGKGFFMFSVNDDQTSGVELSDLQAPAQTDD
jgi:hypothetical protein